MQRTLQPRIRQKVKQATENAVPGRGLAKKIAVQMIGDALPAAGIIRYRALATNSPSLAIARSLGFAGQGQNLIARLPA
jgi:hypothetical protein